jgi:RNA polymerase sigma-70 factor, ECF subfamily
MPANTRFPEYPLTGRTGGKMIDLVHIRNVIFSPGHRQIVLLLKLEKPSTIQQETFIGLVNENRGILYKICRMYGATEPDRQDLFQEMVIQLWRSYPTFRGDARFSTWLYRIALNTAISDLRKQRRRPASIDPDLLPNQLQDIQYSSEKEEQLQQLYSAIDRLTELEKALTMLYLEDKSYQEMEEILGISQNNLRVKMNRIKDKLRKMTKEAVYGIG